MRTYSRSFDVWTSGDSIGPGLAAAYAGLPFYGDPHPEDPGAVVKEIESNNADDHPQHYNVTINYTSDLGDNQGQNPGSAPTDPLLYVTQWEYDTVNATKFVTEDEDGLALLNPVGDPYAPQEVEFGLMQATATVNRANFDHLAAASLIGKTNSGSWGQGTRAIGNLRGLMKSIRAKQVYGNGAFYFTVSYTVLIARENESWRPTFVLRQGLRVFAALAGQAEEQAIRKRDALKEIRPEPVLLDASGHETTTPEFDSFHLVGEATFPEV